MSRSSHVNLTALGVGVAFGFMIQAAGFGDADFIHRMLLLQNWYPWEVFASAIAVAAPSLWLLERRKWVTPLGGRLTLNRTSIKPRHFYGGLLFGAGWAFSTTCPVPAIAMVVGGGILGLAVMAGLFTGILIGDQVAGGRVHSPAPLPITSQSAAGASSL
jgi:uncharacterized membrane protein YedE/YeeE